MLQPQLAAHVVAVLAHARTDHLRSVVGALEKERWKTSSSSRAHVQHVKHTESVTRCADLGGGSIMSNVGFI